MPLPVSYNIVWRHYRTLLIFYNHLHIISLYWLAERITLFFLTLFYLFLTWTCDNNFLHHKLWILKYLLSHYWLTNEFSQNGFGLFEKRKHFYFLVKEKWYVVMFLESLILPDFGCIAVLFGLTFSRAGREFIFDRRKKNYFWLITAVSQAQEMLEKN